MTDSRTGPGVASGAGSDGSGQDPGNSGTAVVLTFVTSALLLMAVLYSVQGVLHPVVVACALFISTHPFRRAVWVVYLRKTVVLLVGVWLVVQLRDMLIPFVIAFALAYVLDPVVDGICGKWKPFRRLRIRRWLASLVVIGLLVLLGVSVGAQVGNMLLSQADELASLVQTAEQQLQNLADSSRLQESDLLQRVFHSVVEAVGEITTRLPAIARGLFSKLGVALAGFFGALLTVVLLFYALKDFDLLVRLIRDKYIPESVSRLMNGRMSGIDATLKSFIGGYVLTSLFVAVMTLLILLLFGYRGVALVLAIITGLLNIIPVIGFWTSTAIILVVGLAKGLGLFTLGLLTLCLGALNVVEGNILQPRIIGRRIGLHPLFFILGVAVFAKLLGLAGALIGIPLAAIISREWQAYVDRSRAMDADGN